MRLSGTNRRRLTAFLCSLLPIGGFCAAGRAAAPNASPAVTATSPSAAGLGDAVVYCLFPPIFSPQGNFAGVTTQLPRLKKLGVTVLWLMPVTPVGKAIAGHPTFDSPYCVHDYRAVNPAYGTAEDLKKLVAQAHRLGIKVILDEVLNHTAWDNTLTQTHPDFYVHSDGNRANPNSIVQAFNYGDVAQLNYENHELWHYMSDMLGYWVKTYQIDGFRFDSADDPYGPNRKIPFAFWQYAAEQLKPVKPDLIMLGECEDPELAHKPFAIDYGWWLRDALKPAMNGTPGSDAAKVAEVWKHQHEAFPSGMLHLSLQDDWDVNRDVVEFGSPQGALAATFFYQTTDGVPLIYNGMEIGNAATGVNPHTPIDWSKSDPTFAAFYPQMLTLRHDNPALQQGATVWLANSAPAHVLTYTRADAHGEFLVEINLSDAAVQGTITVPDSSWVEVTPPAVLSAGTKHVLPPRFELGPKGFALFKRVIFRP